ncbi:MAG: hypothetical protein KF865_04780 [Bdellovibrionaceae bacterium]|nr:hypothetical protein [Pseudobdellovibrionaceae bacterium]
MLKHFVQAALVTSALALTACGSNTDGIVKDVAVRTYIDPTTQHTMVELKGELAGSLMFPNTGLSFYDPKNPSVPVGYLTLESTLEGKNMLSITADVNAARLGGSLTDTKLPNGMNLPITGLTNLIALKALNANTRLYIGESANGKMMFGLAVAMKEFDGLAGTVPNSFLFGRLPEATGVTGVGGLFTGSVSGTSGLGLFVQTDIANPIGGMSLKSAAAKTGAPMSFKTNTWNKQDMWKAQYFFWSLGRRPLTLAK